MPLLTSFLASAPGTTTLNATQVLQEILQDCLEKFLHYKTSALPGLSPVHAPPPCGLCRCSRPFLPVLRRYNKPERNPGDLARLPQEFLHWKAFANRVALEAGQQQRSNARRHCTAGGSSGEREEERHGVAGC